MSFAWRPDNWQNPQPPEAQQLPEATEDQPHHSLAVRITALVLLVAFIVSTLYFMSRSTILVYHQQQPERDMRGCARNLEYLNRHVVAHAKTHDRFPAHLDDALPGFSRDLPFCPAAGRDTYSSSYCVSSDGQTYTVFCQGHFHDDAGLDADYPRIRNSLR